MRLLVGITDLIDMSLSRLRKLVMDSMLRSTGSQRGGYD